jgi:cobalt-zinc-cadmium efflux system protein
LSHAHEHHHDRAHDHGHDHVHGPGGHVHAPADFGLAFALGVGLNSLFIVAEVVFGLFGNSVALLADAGHNFGDVLGLLVAWGASVLVKRRPTARFTYGLRGSSILAALFNAVFLLIAVGAIALEAIQRLGRPEPVSEATVMAVAFVGILVNGGTALLFASGRKGDLNIRGAFLHMLSDALVSAGVVAAGLVILLTGWVWLDPVVSLAIAVVIVWGTWSLLSGSVKMSLAAVPEGIDPAGVRKFLLAQPGVAEVHDLHIWSMSTTETALTAHLVMPAGPPGDDFLHHVCDELDEDFSIGHATIQIETGAAGQCALAHADAV